MPTVDFKPLANGVGANVVNQAAYLVLLGPGGALQDGYQSGTAESNQVNKTLRQSSMMAAGLATAVSEILGVDVLDDGDLTALVAKIKLALTGAAWRTGDGKLTLQTAAESGWVMADDGTIGNAGSGATSRANADTLALYSLLWTNVSQTYATVSTGRGANPAADFAALKTITLTKQLGRALIIAGAGAGLTARVLGEILGAENAVVVEHTHTTTFDLQFLAGGAAPNILVVPGSGVPSAGVATGGATGGTSATGKNMQPSAAWNVTIKL